MKHSRLIRGVGTFLVFLAIFIPTPQIAHAQDYDREARWRAEVEPTITVGDAVDLNVDNRKVFSIYTEGKSKRVGIVLVHGAGVHPDHGVAGKLRVSLSDAGYSVLSVQMPVLAKEETDASKYHAVFPSAYRRIDAAAAWFAAKGYQKVVLASHSMGAWMSNEYFANAKATPYVAWACIGITGRITGTGNFSGPILDLIGEKDFKVTLDSAWLRKMKLWLHAGSETVVIPGADHYYAGKENEASAAIVKFVERVTK
jgi:pimeloyl-ACP methyl ester carboxylesterase